MPTAAADPLAGLPIALQLQWAMGFSRSASSTYCYKYACVVLTCEKPRRASVSAASRRHPWIIRAGGGRSGPVALLVFLPAAARARVVPSDFFARSAHGLVAVPATGVLAAVQSQLRRPAGAFLHRRRLLALHDLDAEQVLQHIALAMVHHRGEHVR